MNWEPAFNLLIQVPLVGLFAWVMLEIDKRNKASQEKRDAQYMQSLSAITAVLTKLNMSFERHDERMVNALEDLKREKDHAK
jgi:hypothetical protein